MLDNPLMMLPMVFCIIPGLLFGLGVWVGRGMPGLPFEIKVARRGEMEDWTP